MPVAPKTLINNGGWYLTPLNDGMWGGMLPPAVAEAIPAMDCFRFLSNGRRAFVLYRDLERWNFYLLRSPN